MSPHDAHGQLQGMQHPLGRKVVRDDALSHDNRVRGNAERLRVQPEVDDQLLGRPGDAAEVGIRSRDVRVVDLYLLALRRLQLVRVLLARSPA